MSSDQSGEAWGGQQVKRAARAAPSDIVTILAPDEVAISYDPRANPAGGPGRLRAVTIDCCVPVIGVYQVGIGGALRLIQ